ncbi:unnamed protein product [Brachionus calyciflorus]|uniref:Ubiquitin carboxyl-terminal hydrolase MINDY n=1 Tax=Brachionus calyciflorus TaxID=104777 RepID=A0A813QK72_9BILA|nr:unnamed protein product [Brachionus calyciflorus]
MSFSENHYNIELNLDLNYINCSATALIREYLARKGLRNTLEVFDEENSVNNSANISSRSKLIEFLKIQNIYEKNKTLKNPFKTVLELLLSFHSAKLSKQNSGPQSKVEEMGSKKSSIEKSVLSQKFKSDLKIDDTEEGELNEGDEKRIISKKNEEKEKKKLIIDKKSQLSDSLKFNKNKIDSENGFESKSEISEAKNTKDEKPFNFQNYLTNPGSKKNYSSDSNLNDRESSSEFSIKKIDFETAQNLRKLLFGNIVQSFNDEWKIQTLKFCDFAKLKFGIVQKKGGPCGVLAAIQSYTLLELIFGNNDETSKDLNLIFNVGKKDRSKALAKGISKLLWKCGANYEAVVASPTSKAHFPSNGKYRTDGFTETLNLIKFNNYQNLEEYLCKNVELLFEQENNYGCIALLYSAIFSRKIDRIINDMDDANNKLMGTHGYCSMEMVNLLIHGRAVSNVFNDKMMLDQLELKGPDKRNDIGLLSLFEHYKSCEVGSYYKTPKYPIWIVCSESHFSVLFSLKKEILNDWKAESKFDLYYYDGLARQSEQIKLTIMSQTIHEKKPSFFDEIYKNKKADKEKELIPPLELVIRTKWKNASIDWNSTDPIL